MVIGHLALMLMGTLGGGGGGGGGLVLESVEPQLARHCLTCVMKFHKF